MRFHPAKAQAIHSSSSLACSCQGPLRRSTMTTPDCISQHISWWCWLSSRIWSSQRSGGRHLHDVSGNRPRGKSVWQHRTWWTGPVRSRHEITAIPFTWLSTAWQFPPFLYSKVSNRWQNSRIFPLFPGVPMLQTTGDGDSVEQTAKCVTAARLLQR